MKYEMIIPAGITTQIMADIINKYNLELKHTDYGPALYGEKEDLEKAKDEIIKALNERISELEKQK
jgi:hypothetical protein